jgi:hypothetical protein
MSPFNAVVGQPQKLTFISLGQFLVSSNFSSYCITNRIIPHLVVRIRPPSMFTASQIIKVVDAGYEKTKKLYPANICGCMPTHGQLLDWNNTIRIKMCHKKKKRLAFPFLSLYLLLL